MSLILLAGKKFLHDDYFLSPTAYLCKLPTTMITISLCIHCFTYCNSNNLVGKWFLLNNYFVSPTTTYTNYLPPLLLYDGFIIKLSSLITLGSKRFYFFMIIYLKQILTYANNYLRLWFLLHDAFIIDLFTKLTALVRKKFFINDYVPLSHSY